VDEQTAQSSTQLALGPVPATREEKNKFPKQEKEGEENFPGGVKEISIQRGTRRKGNLKKKKKK